MLRGVKRRLLCLPNVAGKRLCPYALEQLQEQQRGDHLSDRSLPGLNPGYLRATPARCTDSGQTGTVTWQNFSYTGTRPAGTALQFQVATSNSPNGPWVYVGPDGTTGSYFVDPVVAPLHAGTTGRYASYKAWLTSDTTGTLTPSFSAVALSFSLAGSNTSTQWAYAIDAAQNILALTTTTDAGVATSVRAVNTP